MAITELNFSARAYDKVLELNPRHPILLQLKDLDADAELGKVIIEQIYESALLIEDHRIA